MLEVKHVSVPNIEVPGRERLGSRVSHFSTLRRLRAELLYRAGIVAQANSIVLVHNHPSGNVRPSAEDMAFTGRIVDAARLLGIDLLDHLIVGRRAFFSFREGGLIGDDHPGSWKAS